MNRLLVACTMLLTALVSAQPFYHPVYDVDVSVSGTLLKTPWLGGFNNPLFSDIDLDDNGTKDLWVFEATEGHFYSFRNLGIPDSVSYQFDPQFIPHFPHAKSHPWQGIPVLHEWAFLVDYNCDGLEDIFSYSNAGAQVYRAGRNGAGALEFDFVTYVINYWDDPNWINIYLSSIDYPAFVDVDGDSDMDILTFEFLGPRIQFYQNQSVQLGYGCDSLIFEKKCGCWGYIKENINTFSIELQQSCPCLTAPQPDGEGPRHAGGSAIVSFDQDDDGDIELIISDVGFDNVIYAHNGRSGGRDSMVWVDDNFPSYNLPVDLPVFPAGSMLNVNNDEFDDLLFAPFLNNFCRLDQFLDTSLNTSGIWHYKGVGPDVNKQFEYQANDFLVGGMIDLGENSHPAFFDYDADGLLDIVAGNCYAFGETEQLRWGLTLFRNTGTLSSPQFEFVTDDYQGLDSMQVIGLHPTFGDLDDDDDLDMVCGTAHGKLMWFENTAGPGNPAQLSYLGDIVDSTFYGAFRSPQLVDVDRDGLLDLIAGADNGQVYYYENKGTPSVPDFEKITSFFGGILVDEFSVPQLVGDGSGGTYRLYVGSSSGRIHLYDNIEGKLAGTFNLVTKVAADTFLGAKTSPAMADLNGDGILEMIIGNQRGGLTLASSHDWTFAQQPIQQTITVSAFPVPAGDQLTVCLSQVPGPSWTVTLQDASARIVLSSRVQGARAHLDVADLPAGLHFARVAGTGVQTTLKVVIAH
jgi:hypothetical protein